MKRSVILLLTAALTLMTATSVLADATDDLITKYYQDILDRNPGLPEVGGWRSEVDRIVTLGIDVKEVFIALGKLFFNSDEYTLQSKDNSAYLTDLYQTFFDRLPDQGGFDFWKDLLDQGLARNVLFNFFAFSDEFRLFMEARLGVSSSSPENDLINDHYRGILNRMADTDGFNGWLEMMHDAQCGGAAAVRTLSLQITSGFLQGPEYALRGRDDVEFLEDLYNGILRRGATLEEFNGWIALMSQGMTREQVLQSFTDSPEFQLRVQEVIDAADTDACPIEGSWVGTGVSTTPFDFEGDPCGGFTLNMTVVNNQMTGSGTAGPDTFIVSGSVDTNGTLNGLAEIQGTPVATFEGSLTSTSASGTWQDFFGCRGTWSATKQ
ncbi:MAG: DUF4214 domain-containing protein [Desulfobacterales bacterium]|nr:MAG: DUF4214 domain-containing protein [Desulfobacterales bacterium]